MLRRRSAGVVLAMIGAVLLPAPGPAAAAPAEFPGVPLWSPSHENGLAYDAYIYRAINNPAAGRNVAVFRYVLPNGEVRTLAIESAPCAGKCLIEGHSERRLGRILTRWGIKPSAVTHIYSELEPCSLRGSFCKRYIARTFTKLKSVSWSFDYPSSEGSQAERQRDAAIRRQSNKAKQSAVVKLRKDNGLPGGKSGYRGQYPKGRYPVPNTDLTRPRPQLPVRSLKFQPHFIPKLPPGGIDFSSLELRYVSADERGGIDYAFRGRPAANASDPAAGLESTGQASDALFAWLALPRESFFVNLHPLQPDNVVEAKLGRTDAGRVLAEADFQLKKTSGALMNPSTPTGARYLDALEGLYGDHPWEACDVVRRLTIVPQPASVHETGDELYILDAPLTVDTGRMPDLGPQTGYDCPQQDPVVEARKDALFSELIIPELVKAVNTAPEYAELRRVYLSRVAAEWLRARSATTGTAVSSIIDSGNVEPWVSQTPWNPRELFDRFVHSYYHDKITVQRSYGDLVYDRIIPVGGVMFDRIERREIGEREFKTRYPRRAEQMRRAQGQVVKSGDEVWLGDGAATSASVPWVGLRVRTPGSYRAGQDVTYRLDVINPTDRTVRDVRVCDQPPSQLRGRQRCWTIPRLASGRSKTLTVRAHAYADARGRARHQATATVRDSAIGTSARKTVAISGAQRAGGVTG